MCIRDAWWGTLALLWRHHSMAVVNCAVVLCLYKCPMQCIGDWDHKRQSNALRVKPNKHGIGPCNHRNNTFSLCFCATSGEHCWFASRNVYVIQTKSHTNLTKESFPVSLNLQQFGDLEFWVALHLSMNKQDYPFFHISLQTFKKDLKAYQVTALCKPELISS